MIEPRVPSSSFAMASTALRDRPWPSAAATTQETVAEVAVLTAGAVSTTATAAAAAAESPSGRPDRRTLLTMHRMIWGGTASFAL